MSTLEPGIIARIAAQDADACRIAADWLLEQGDERGEFILDELALEARPNPAVRKDVLARRAKRRDSHFGAWATPLLALGATGYEFRRGFIDLVRLPESALGALPQMLELEPVTRLRVQLADGAALARAMRDPSFQRIRGLDLDGTPRLEVAAPALTRLVLRTASEPLVAGLPALFPALETLGVAFTPAGDAALAAVTGGRLALKRLWACAAGVSSPTLLAFADSASALEELDLGSNDLSRASVQRLGASLSLKALHTLALRQVAAAHGFLTRTGLPALKKLKVKRPHASDRALYLARGVALS